MRFNSARVAAKCKGQTVIKRCKALQRFDLQRRQRRESAAGLRGCDDKGPSASFDVKTLSRIGIKGRIPYEFHVSESNKGKTGKFDIEIRNRNSKLLS